MFTQRRIALIGTGLMGAPIARRLADAGHLVSAWNRHAKKLEPLTDAGVQALTSPRDVVSAEIVIVMLSSGPVCDEILLGDDGVIAAMAAGSALVVMSSIPVATAQNQARVAAQRDIDYLDAPVSGGERGARDGTLAIMVGGDETAFKRLSPLFEPLGRATRVGAAGCGQLAKLANQLIVANTIAAVAEALLLAERGGADPARVREALLGGFAESSVLTLHARRMIERDFAPGGAARWQYKDTQTALETAATLGLELPVSQRTDALFRDLIEHGDGDLDHSALIRELRRRNGLDVD